MLVKCGSNVGQVFVKCLSSTALVLSVAGHIDNVVKIDNIDKIESIEKIDNIDQIESIEKIENIDEIENLDHTPSSVGQVLVKCWSSVGQVLVKCCSCVVSGCSYR